MRRFLLLSLGALIIISIPLIAFSFVQASPGPGAPAHWTAARNISNSPDGITGPHIGADNNGYLHLVWMDDRTGSGDLYYTKSIDEGTSWSALDPITTDSQSSWGDMAIEPDGTVHVVWIEREEFQSYYVEHGEKLEAGGWLTSTVTIQPGFQLDPAIALDENYIYAVWQKRVDPDNPNIWYSHKPTTDGSWATPQSIAGTETSSLAPDVATDSHGNVHVVWQEDINNGATWYSMGSWSGTLNWSAPITVSESLTGCATPAIALGSDDYVHVVWGQKITKEEQYVYYANFPYNDSSSITPIQVFTEAMGVSEEAPTYLYPRVAIRSDSEVHVVWHAKGGTDTTDQIWYALSEDKGSSWSSPIKISQEAGNQAVAPDIGLDDKIGHVVWQGKDEGGKYQVMYSRGFPRDLLSSASFEERGRIPAPWKGNKNLTAKDKRVCWVRHSGRCSFRMLGTTAKKSLRQVVNISGSAGDTFTLRGWSKARNPLRKGGAYCVKAKVFHTDGTKKTYKKCFAKKTHGWQRRKTTFTTAKDYKKIVVFLRYNKQRGKAWFDDVRLLCH